MSERISDRKKRKIVRKVYNFVNNLDARAKEISIVKFIVIIFKGFFKNGVTPNFVEFWFPMKWWHYFLFFP